MGGGQPTGAGAMFWLWRNRFSGSHSRLSRARRVYFSGPKAAPADRLRVPAVRPEGAPMPAIARMRSVVVDCPDPVALAEFYRGLVGGEITSSEDDWVVLEPEPGRRLAFQLDLGPWKAASPGMSPVATLRL